MTDFHLHTFPNEQNQSSKYHWDIRYSYTIYHSMWTKTALKYNEQKRTVTEVKLMATISFCIVHCYYRFFLFRFFFRLRFISYNIMRCLYEMKIFVHISMRINFSTCSWSLQRNRAFHTAVRIISKHSYTSAEMHTLKDTERKRIICESVCRRRE